MEISFIKSESISTEVKTVEFSGIRTSSSFLQAKNKRIESNART
jgi:hypothetical protein